MRSRLNNRALAAALVCVALAGTTLGQEAPPAGPDLESTRATLAKWVETQQIISREREEWQEGKELLQQRISLLQGEIATLEEKVAQGDESLGEAGARRRDLVGENESLRRVSTSLTEVIVLLETKTGRLLALLPDPLRQKVSPLAERLPQDPARTELSLSQRYQNVIGILNEVNKFNRDITVTSELRTLSDGTVAEVQALYLGLGQAYYVTVDGSAAGVGLPGPEGWEWRPANEYAESVSRAIAILRNEEVPAYVPVPVEIR
jgi:hypothetical protein